MAAFSNTQKINGIKIKQTAKCFCPLGQDWYTNKFEVDFVPDKVIPDYCEIDAWVKENINGLSLVIEDAVGALYQYLMETYRPKSISVNSYVEDSKAHPPVIVSKY